MVSMTQTTDSALVRATRGGDHASFTEMVRRHEKYAYGTAISILTDLDPARDIA
jgi:hypothetical protein